MRRNTDDGQLIPLLSLLAGLSGQEPLPEQWGILDGDEPVNVVAVLQRTAVVEEVGGDNGERRLVALARIRIDPKTFGVRELSGMRKAALAARARGWAASTRQHQAGKGGQRD